ncbi:MAG TPA: methyltransferase domain-containing protein [Planctomycetota bacterium]|nr:methyltransferase domain-containing protein [Planctomycetota bacterium]
MPDVYLTIAEADIAVLEGLAQILELRAADPQQAAIRDAYLDAVAWPADARVMEGGCGTGAVSRAVAARAEVGEVVATDPSPFFVERARELAAGIDALTFAVADARALPFDDATFDVALFHTVLCHVPEPEVALAEACRVLRPGGQLVVFDGDYATTTVAIGVGDPLQACVDAALEALVHDRYFVRGLPSLVAAAGFGSVALASHGYVEAPSSGGYMVALVDRGADALVAAGGISSDAADALKAEARRRSDAGEFFGHIAYASLTAAKPR